MWFRFFNWLCRKFGYALIAAAEADQLLASQLQDPRRVGFEEPWNIQEYLRRVRQEKAAKIRYLDIPGEPEDFAVSGDMGQFTTSTPTALAAVIRLDGNNCEVQSVNANDGVTVMQPLEVQPLVCDQYGALTLESPLE